MTKQEIQALVASIPANELDNVMAQLNAIQAGDYKVINGIGYATGV